MPRGRRILYDALDGAWQVGCAETLGITDEQCCGYHGRVPVREAHARFLARLGSTYMPAIPVVIGGNRTFNKERRI
jgi:hypothetical protein